MAKRRAKRIANHSKNGNKVLSEEEIKLLTLIAGIIIEIILKEIDEEEKTRIEGPKKDIFKGGNTARFEHL